MHQTSMSSLGFKEYRPKGPNKVLSWCLEINRGPPRDSLSYISICLRYVAEVAENKNYIDAHTAQVLTQILSLLITRLPDRSIEDSYVHHFVAPILQSVFSLILVSSLAGQMATM
ncbi:hypothetical protein G6F37_006440 [Rhizopus arrhizus]|nr:hypothetical protein G6F38_006534 [Rhizopus arrhizus]KAG1157733.1 hypothetical protein G6F37_006440 [Rhizopus arrhizus]